MSNPFTKFFGINDKEKEVASPEVPVEETIEVETEKSFVVDEVKEIKLEDIIPNRFQPREVFEAEKIEELASSMRTHGLVQPIVIRNHSQIEGKYEIISGERRFRAAGKLEWLTIPAIVRSYNDKETAAIALIENIQREDLTPIEEARAYNELMKIFELTQEALAQRLGKGQSTVANKMRLLKLPQEVQDAILTRKITERHGRSLLSLKNSEQQIKLLIEIIDKELNVKQTEERVASLLNKVNEQPKKKFKHVGKNIRLAVNELNRVFKTMEDYGYKYEKEEEENEDYYVVKIKIPKNF
ncbi:MAG: noc [Bacillales bacterium]|jgi:ParB family chromosome partitioning protein|nr:noc [Bacillales bacterium]